MLWTDKILKDLNEKYKDELSKYGVTTEDVVKELWVGVRKILSSDKLMDLKIEKFGTFYIKPMRIFQYLGYNISALNYEKSEDKRKERIKKIKEFIEILNFRLKDPNRKNIYIMRFYRMFKHPFIYDEENNILYCGDKIIDWKHRPLWEVQLNQKSKLNN